MERCANPNPNMHTWGSSDLQLCKLEGTLGIAVSREDVSRRMLRREESFVLRILLAGGTDRRWHWV